MFDFMVIKNLQKNYFAKLCMNNQVSLA